MQSNETETGLILSVVKAFKVLELFTNERPEIGISQISRELGMPGSTVHRLVSTLEALGYLRQNSDNERYRLGIGAYILGSRVKMLNELSTIAKPYLAELSNRYNETSHLSITLGNDRLLCIDKSKTNRGFFATPDVGGTHRIHITSSGKAMLAFMPEAEQDRIISQIQFQRYTPNTIMTAEQLKEQLQVIRREGIAIDNEESELGLFCCGAPIFDAEGKCFAAISISMPISRSSSQIDVIKQDVKSFAAKISRELGYRE